MDAALELFDNFGTFSGIRINWSKSLLFPLDSQPTAGTGPSSLKWVTEFKYLGIRVVRDTAQYYNQNVLPLLRLIREKCQSWSALALNLIGCINILKMIILPKVTYFFRNSPTWIPVSFFREVERCIISFIWHGSVPRLAKSTLYLPTNLGGLALPDLRVYYWASMLVTVYWWFEGKRSNAAVCLEAACLGSLQALQNLAYRGLGAHGDLPAPTVATVRVWGVARRRFFQRERWSPVQPLWGNPNLPHFRTIPDPQIWARHGIKTLRDIMPTGVLLSFAQLRRSYELPGWMYFRYIQLDHVAKVQFPNPPVLQFDPVEDLLSCSDLKKALSALYGTLLNTDSPKMDRLWRLWKRDIPTLEREDWDKCLESGPRLVVAAGDKLTQIKFLHRVYFTPVRLSKMYSDRDPHCSRCRMHLGTFMHMFWECPALTKFWSEIYEQLNVRLELEVPRTPELALLGIHEDEQRPHHSKLLISYLFFYARKEILCRL